MAAELWREADLNRRHRDLRSIDIRSLPAVQDVADSPRPERSFSRNAHAQAPVYQRSKRSGGANPDCSLPSEAEA